MTYNSFFFVMGYVVLGFFFYMGYLFWLRHGLFMYGFLIALMKLWVTYFYFEDKF